MNQGNLVAEEIQLNVDQQLHAQNKQIIVENLDQMSNINLPSYKDQQNLTCQKNTILINQDLQVIQLDPMLIKSIESKQLIKLLNTSHILCLIFFSIITTIKLLGLNQNLSSSIAAGIITILQWMIWILSVYIGSIGYKRKKSVYFKIYQMGMILSMIFDVTGTIVILVTDKKTDHSLGRYGRDLKLRFIIYLVLAFLFIFFQITLVRISRQIYSLFTEIDKLNQQKRLIELEKLE